MTDGRKTLAVTNPLPPAAPAPADVCAALAGVSADVLHACAQAGARPLLVSLGTMLDLLDASVTMPAQCVPWVDAVADRYQLPASDDAADSPYYLRTGTTALAAGPVQLTVSCARSGEPRPPAAAALPASAPTAPVPVPDSVVVVPSTRVEPAPAASVLAVTA